MLLFHKAKTIKYRYALLRPSFLHAGNSGNKWMALCSAHRFVLSSANMSYPFRELGHSFPQSLYTTYSNQVRSELGGRPDLCNAFDDLLLGLTSKRCGDYQIDFASTKRLTLCSSISTPEAMDRASWIFRKHPHLLEGFYSILPPVFDLPQEGHKVTLGARNLVWKQKYQWYL